MTRPLHFAISTCPNDTFAFHGILSGQIEVEGLELDLGDVEELNQRLAKGELDGAKASFHAALRLSDRYAVLPVGAALGYGVGPLVLAGKPAEDLPRNPRVLCPGVGTTASLLYRIFHPDEGTVHQVVFDQIMPALETGAADLGVCIHEGRFTWQDRGLHLIDDLGTRWEEETGTPLPLGGLLVRRDLEPERIRALISGVRASLDVAWSDRPATLPTMRRYAQELADDVLEAHVDLYVNDDTRALGPAARGALRELEARARLAGVPVPAPLEVL